MAEIPMPPMPIKCTFFPLKKIIRHYMIAADFLTITRKNTKKYCIIEKNLVKLS